LKLKVHIRQVQKKTSANGKEFKYFYSINYYEALGNMGWRSGIRKKLLPDPDPGVKKINGSGRLGCHTFPWFVVNSQGCLP
jgi:hypothetical protein